MDRTHSIDQRDGLAPAAQARRREGAVAGEISVFDVFAPLTLISVNLRGAKSDAVSLKAIGEQAVRVLFTTLKNQDSHHYKIELDLLSRIAAQPLNEKQVTGSAQRVLMEMAKQKLVQPSAGGWRLTPLGTWYITSAPE